MLPRLPIAHLPTPIEPLPRLAHAIGLSNLYVKRDDLTGLAFGGNKTRKLEFLVAEALANNARTLITAGALQSNHCRQTAAAAARAGLDCILVLSGPQPEQLTANLLLDQLFGARLVWAKNPSDRQRTLESTFATAQKDGLAPYLVPYGGSSPTGALGYVYAMQELISQTRPVSPGASIPSPDWIVFASSSGGTQAGMVLGKELFSFQGHLLGISVDEPAATLQARVSTLATATAQKMGQPHQFSPSQVLVDDSFCSSGYGVLTPAETEAIHLFARLEGLLLDPVYTGRAAAGLITLARQQFFQPHHAVLFWHTGGQPALFASPYADSL